MARIIRVEAKTKKIFHFFHNDAVMGPAFTFWSKCHKKSVSKMEQFDTFSTCTKEKSHVGVKEAK